MADHLFHGVDHGAGAQEEHRLEEGMGDQVEHARHRGPATHGQHHVAELADGAVGQTFLEVHLGEGNRGPQEQGDGSNDGHDDLHFREGHIDGLEAGHQKDARRHHGCRVNQGRDGGWTLHRIGQPDMEGELGRLRHRSHEHQQAEQDRDAVGDASGADRLLEAHTDLFKAEAAGGPEQSEDAQQEAEVTDAVHHKGFLGGIGGAIAVVPEADEQVGAHAHQLPEHIDLQQVGADHQPKHRTAEQGQIGEEADIAFVVGHVAVGVDHHQDGDGRH